MTAAAAPLRVLTATTLYPNAAMPNHGVFVENRQRHLQADGQASVTVIAPVPWFPLAGARFGRAANQFGRSSQGFGGGGKQGIRHVRRNHKRAKSRQPRATRRGPGQKNRVRRYGTITRNPSAGR